MAPHPKALRHSLTLAWVLLGVGLVPACAEPEVRPIDPRAQRTFDVELSTDRLDLGSQQVGLSAVASLSIINHGNVPALVGQLEVPDGAAWSATVDDPLIDPGGMANVVVKWNVERPGILEQPLQIWVGPDDSSQESHTVSVNGSGIGAQLALSVRDFDLGEVALGCRKNLRVTASNAGNEPLVVDSIALQGDHTFTLSDNEAFPWVIPPFASREFSVDYAPVGIDGDRAIATVHSTVGSPMVTVQGRGVAEGDGRVDVRVTSRRGVRLIFLVNWIVEYPMSGFSAVFWDSIPALFDALHSTNLDFRVAFVYAHSGQLIGGDVIDDSYATRTAVLEVENHLAGLLAYRDNDAYGPTLAKAVQANELWLFEDDFWKEASLGLVTITPDNEQSTVPYTSYVADAQSWYPDVKFHAIAGPPVPTCRWAVDLTTYRLAITSTGGTFLDFCEADWSDHMRKIVAASSSGVTNDRGQIVGLSGTPLAESIFVTLDGEPLLSGWEYDAKLNAIILSREFSFDGDLIQVTYKKSDVCGG